VGNNGSTQPMAAHEHKAPVLCAAFNTDGSKVFSGDCANEVLMWDLQTENVQQVGSHDAPCKEVSWVDEISLLLTSSWDKTLRFWDTRSANPEHGINLPERVYSMDSKGWLCAIACAERQIVLIDLRNPSQPTQTFSSPLKYASRVISCFPDSSGFALGSIEGRVAIHHYHENQQMKNFAFKCHRNETEIFAVNSISFHPGWGTFATAGSDGTFNFWDKDSKQRLKPFHPCPVPISAGAFNSDGSIYAYACSYDWSKGAEYADSTSYILLHGTPDSEIRSREKKRR